MTGIAENLNVLLSQVPSSVKLVAVSKTRQPGQIMELYSEGHRYFGENRVQELLNKMAVLPKDIEWHMIGHLQRNKVKQIVPFISLIQSVDSYKLLETINTEALKISRVVDCLLQIHIAEEETKFGFSIEELPGVLDSSEFKTLENVRICGIMGMATFTNDKNQVQKEFCCLKNYFNTLKKSYFNGIAHFKEISMGMSDDYKIAIEEGSTLIRIGSLIFGKRERN